jgi:2-polyprenyl-6-methoxyphenol hydroxylase-like FAD-dependent oxidoreductase
MNGHFETYIRPYRGFAAVPTHDDLTLVIAGWPYAEFETNKKDIEGHYQRVLELAPQFNQRAHQARRETKLVGAAVSNFFRKPYGPGWLLVGDAGYTKDPITAQGITDAFHDAERWANALDESFRGVHSFEEAMCDAQRSRDEQVMPMYEFTCQLASLEPPPPEMREFFAAIHGRPKAMDDFVRMNAGTISPAMFFAPDNIAAILASRSES